MAGNSIKTLGALSLMAGDGGAALPPDPRINSIIDQVTASVAPDSDEKWRDEQLAFAGGMTDPSGNGSFGGALTAGFKAQSKQRQDTKELSHQYLPTILNALTAQQAQQQTAMLMQNMVGDASGGWIDRVSKQYNLAPEAIRIDLVTNGGKGIREMIYKNSTPEYTVQDNALIDKNPYTNGMVGGKDNSRLVRGVKQSADGTTTIVQPTPDGKSASIEVPRGANDAVRGFATTKAEVGAEHELETVIPRGENPQVTTKGELLRRARQGPSTPGGGRSGPPPAGSAPAQGGGVGPGLPPEVSGALQGLPAANVAATGSFQGGANDVMRAIADIKDPQERANAMEGYSQQLGGKRPDPALADAQTEYKAATDARDATRAARARQTIEQLTGNPPSVGMELESPAEQKRSIAAVDTEQKNFAGNLSEMKKAKNSVAQLDRAISLLEGKDKPTSSGVGELVDAGAAFFGKSAPGAAQAEALKTLQGWLTSNVPRMEGPQSNFDVGNYQIMTGMVGNPKLPLETRLAAAKEAKRLIMDAAPKEFGSGFLQEDKPGPGGPPAGGGMPTMEQIMAERKRRQGGK